MNKRVKLTLVGLDGNAFNLLGHFQQAAAEQGWSQQEIKAVVTKAMAGNYDNLLRVLMDHTEEEDECPACGCDEVCPECGAERDYDDGHGPDQEWPPGAPKYR